MMRLSDLARRRLRVIRRRPQLSFGLALLGLIVLLCIVVPWVSPYSTTTFVGQPFAAPSFAHPFGTDDFGRDVMTRAFDGGRIDLEVAAFATIFSCLVGTLLGVISGATRFRWLDSLLMGFVDAIVAFPFIVLILALVVVFGATQSLGPLPPGVPSLMVAILLTDWVIYARLSRAETLSLRQADFVVAARVAGCSPSRVIMRHLIPNVMSVSAAYAVADGILVIISTASLPFLGAGVQPPAPEWGNMMFEGQAFLSTAWWIALFPAMLLASTGIAVMLVADALLARTRE
jgi:peptide/nickel transport system permease protein